MDKILLAQNTIPYLPKTDIAGPPQEGILTTFFQPLISLVPVVTGTLAFFVILISGIRYITHAGNPVETKKSADMLTYAIVGLGLSALAFTFTQLLFQVGGGQGLF